MDTGILENVCQMHAGREESVLCVLVACGSRRYCRPCRLLCMKSGQSMHRLEIHVCSLANDVHLSLCRFHSRPPHLLQVDMGFGNWSES